MYEPFTLTGGVLLVCTAGYDLATTKGYLSSGSERAADQPDELPRVGSTRDQTPAQSDDGTEGLNSALRDGVTASTAHEWIVLAGYILGALLLVPGALEYGGLI